MINLRDSNKLFSERSVDRMLTFVECVRKAVEIFNDSEYKKNYELTATCNNRDDDVLFWMSFKEDPKWTELEKMLYAPLDGFDGFSVSKKDGSVKWIQLFLDGDEYSSDDGKKVNISEFI